MSSATGRHPANADLQSTCGESISCWLCNWNSTASYMCEGKGFHLLGWLLFQGFQHLIASIDMRRAFWACEDVDKAQNLPRPGASMAA